MQIITIEGRNYINMTEAYKLFKTDFSQQHFNRLLITTKLPYIEIGVSKYFEYDDIVEFSKKVQSYSNLKNTILGKNGE